MPGNMIKINDSDDLSWYVGDSKMEELIKWLSENGYREAGYTCNKPYIAHLEKESEVKK